MQENAILHRPQSSIRLAVCGLLLAALAGGSGADVAAQSAPSIRQELSPLPDAPQPQGANPAPQLQSDDIAIRSIPRNFLKDQGVIWTSPARFHLRDIEWLAPLAAATGAAVATDHRTMTQVVSRNPDFNHANVDASNILIGVWIASPVTVYGVGRFRDNAPAREAGILSAESMLDGVVVEQGIKLIFWRERPYVDDARGHFFQSSAGADSSFPSSHSLIAWSAASAFAAESSSHWTQFALYAGAAGVSLTRIMGQKHFPSDVLVGSATGWLIGHYVVRRHHHASLTTPDVGRYSGSKVGVPRSH
ncbi:MAG: phosphatase PAP2 family protein [Terracidiphilus sp.]